MMSNKILINHDICMNLMAKVSSQLSLNKPRKINYPQKHFDFTMNSLLEVYKPKVLRTNFAKQCL